MTRIRNPYFQYGSGSREAILNTDPHGSGSDKLPVSIIFVNWKLVVHSTGLCEHFMTHYGSASIADPERFLSNPGPIFQVITDLGHTLHIIPAPDPATNTLQRQPNVEFFSFSL